MERDTAYLIFSIVIFGIVMLGGIVWMIFQWHECREVMVFSFWYCIKHVL